jgi:hypothetical protein
MLTRLEKLIAAALLATPVLLAPLSFARAAPADAEAADKAVAAADPCAAIGGQKWVAPSAVRACFQSFPVNETIKSNVS